MSKTYETVRLIRAGAVANLVLNRPAVRNAFNDVMIHELREVFQYLAQTYDLRVVTLTGEGNAFCAGADVHWMQRVLGYSYEQNYADSLALAQLMRQIYEFPCPVIARVNGPAIGGGTGIVAAADIAIAVESATFSFSEVKIGLVPAAIAPYVLKRVGERAAREYFLTGERLSAAKAYHCGLLNRVVQEAELDEIVHEYVQALLVGGPSALATCKALIPAVSGMSLDKAAPFTADVIARLRMSEEGQEGMSAFLQRRRPAWWQEPEESSWTDGLGET